MASILSRLKQRLDNARDRSRRRDFLEGAMAAAVLVAYADGDASLEEGNRVGDFLRNNEALQVFDPQQGIDIYLNHIAAIRRGADGRASARGAVRQAAAEGADAVLIVAICLAISEADGEVKMAEVSEIERICRVLGVDAEQVKVAQAMIAAADDG